MTHPYDSDPYRRGSALSRSFLPLALITLGVVFLLSNLLPERGRGGLIVLGLGAAFLVGRLTTRRYGYAVPAGILMAIGAFISLQDLQGLRGVGSAGLFFVLLGSGFAAIYFVGLRPSAIWPLFPGAVLICIGLVLLGVSTLGALASWSWIAGYWPAALVLLGLWLLIRDSLPAPVRRPLATLGGLALLAYGIFAATASVAAGGTLVRTGASPFPESVDMSMPISPGQTFTVNNSSGRTTIRGGSGTEVHVVVSRRFGFGGFGGFGGPNPDARLVQTADGVGLDASGAGRSLDYTIDLPASAAVKAQSSSGQLEIDDVQGPVDASTSSGSVSLNGVFTQAVRVSASSGSVKVKLLSGSAEQLDVHSNSGSVEPQGGFQLVGGTTNRNTLTGAYNNPAPGAILNVQTSSGSITISQ